MDSLMATVGKNKKMLAGSGGLIAVFTALVFSYIDAKTSNIDQGIDHRYAQVKEYVDLRHAAIDDRLKSIESLLKTIDSRVYDLTKRKGE
jgi:uncharacterized iron-regulated protein